MFCRLLVGAIAAIIGTVLYLGSQPPMMPFSCYALKLWCPAPVVTGNVMPGWEPVLDAWRKNFNDGYELGSQMSIFWNNKHVVDVALGYSDPTFSTPFSNDTLQMIYSSTKVVESLVIAMLVDRGHVKYTDKIASFWPEFAANGKQDVTVGDLMAHAGGVHAVNTPLDLETVTDPQKLSKALADTKLDERSFRQKGKQAYNAITRGFYSSQICRRVDPKHRSLKQFAEEEIFKPMGIEFHIGVSGPELVGGMHGVGTMKMLTGMLPRMLLPDWLTDPFYTDRFLTPLEESVFKEMGTNGSISHGSIMNVFAHKFVQWSDWIDTPGWSAIESPSTHGFTKAYSMARIANALVNGGTDPFTGVQLLSQRGLEAAEKPSSLGYVIDGFLLTNVSYTESGWSDRIPSIIELPEGHKCIGWAGAGGSVFQWCPSVHLAFAFTPNYYAPHFPDWRAGQYLAAAHKVALSLAAKK